MPEEDFDQIAIVVDWLDACRKRDLPALLDLYAEDASLECACDGIAAFRASLRWKPIGGRGSKPLRRPRSEWRKSPQALTGSCSTI